MANKRVRAVDRKLKGRYAAFASNPEKTAKARVSDSQAHFKNTRETVKTLQGMPLVAAQKYLRDVLNHKRCVPFRRFCGGVGRTAQAKEWKNSLGRWPEKSVKAVQSLLINARSNALSRDKPLEVRQLRIWRIQANRARQLRRRTYRAHGRIGAFMRSPSHIQVILKQDQTEIKAPEADAQ